MNLLIQELYDYIHKLNDQINLTLATSSIDNIQLDKWCDISIDKFDYYVYTIAGFKHRENGPAVTKKYSDTDYIGESYIWYKKDKRHRENGPALYSSCRLLPSCQLRDRDIELLNSCKLWYKNGKKHRRDGPAIIEWDADGFKHQEEWYINDKYHRTDGPALIVYGNKHNMIPGSRQYNVYPQMASWYKNGKVHREGGPAVLQYMFDFKMHEAWYKNDKKHREDGPADIRYGSPVGFDMFKQYPNDIYYNRKIDKKEWYKQDLEHRDNGPSYIDEFEQIWPQTIKAEVWYKDGVQINPILKDVRINPNLNKT